MIIAVIFFVLIIGIILAFLGGFGYFTSSKAEKLNLKDNSKVNEAQKETGEDSNCYIEEKMNYLSITK